MAAAVVLAFLPIFGLLGCGESEKFTADDLVLIHTVYYGTETSLDKGTQRKTTENELPSLTQCTA